MKTVVVRLTSRGVGAIAVLQVAGPRAAEVIARLCESKREIGVGGVLHTNLVERDLEGNGTVLDDALVVRTEVDQYELHVHGGKAVVDAVTEVLGKAGVEAVSPEEGLRQRGKPIDLHAELAMSFSKAQTMTAVRLLGGQVESGLREWANGWIARVQALESEGELWRLHSAAQWLLERSRALARLLEPPRIAIVGPPNAGKSTLANALLGRPISITSEIAGTTRDWVDARAMLTGPSRNGLAIEVPITLVDTAGVRETDDLLEQESIRRTHGQAKIADVIILLLDASTFRVDEVADFLMQHQETAYVVGFNKVDLLADRRALTDAYPHAVLLSASQYVGLDELMARVLGELDLAAIRGDEPFAFTRRQRQLLEELGFSRVPEIAGRLLHELVDGRKGE